MWNGRPHLSIAKLFGIKLPVRTVTIDKHRPDTEADVVKGLQYLLEVSVDEGGVQLCNWHQRDNVSVRARQS